MALGLGIVGRKLGMTRIFTDDGVSICVTVIEAKANRVTQIKNLQKDGYDSIQLTFGNKKVKKLNKSQIGHFAKSGSQAGIGLVEFRIYETDLGKFNLGSNVDISIFDKIRYVDVSGISKGKGFAGCIKRHNFRSQRASHGNSLSHNMPGSIGQCQDPGRVFKGKRMAGHLGNEKVTVQNLEIIKLDKERELLLIKGAVPGSINGRVSIIPSVKVGM